MIFFVSTNSEFETTSLVETKDFNIGSEGDIFLVDNAKLSGSNKLGNNFNIKAKKINQIDNKFQIISGSKISGDINISSQIHIKIKAKTADLHTKRNELKLYGGFQIVNEKYKIFGKEISAKFFGQNFLAKNFWPTILGQNLLAKNVWPDVAPRRL